LNNEKNGMGKEYDSDGKLAFEGLFLNGERKKRKILLDYEKLKLENLHN